MRLMRACEATRSQLASLNYPVYASPKIDGIRFVHRKKSLQSRTLKDLPNLELQQRFGNIPILNNLEGEITIGNPMDAHVFRKTSSYVMSKHAKEDMIDLVSLFVFDITDKDDLPYSERYKLLQELSGSFPKGMCLLEQTLITSYVYLMDYEANALNMGAEGIMIRVPNTLYKHGESTLSKMELIKLKRFCDSEAKIIDVIESTINRDTLGSILVQDIKTKIEFNIGTGFTHYEKDIIWKKKKRFIGQYVKYKYSPMGEYNKPRFPVYLGFRDPIDIIDFPEKEIIQMLNS